MFLIFKTAYFFERSQTSEPCSTIKIKEEPVERSVIFLYAIRKSLGKYRGRAEQYRISASVKDQGRAHRNSSMKKVQEPIIQGTQPEAIIKNEYKILSVKRKKKDKAVKSEPKEPIVEKVNF